VDVSAEDQHIWASSLPTAFDPDWTEELPEGVAYIPL